MKRKLFLIFFVLAFLAGFGALLHSPPSVLDMVSGATPKAKKTAQASASLQGDYLFCINPKADGLSSPAVRNALMNFVSGKQDALSSLAPGSSYSLSICKTDDALIQYAETLEASCKQAGIKLQIRRYSSVMLRSRAVSGRFSLLVASSSADILDEKALEQTDYMILHSDDGKGLQP